MFPKFFPFYEPPDTNAGGGDAQPPDPDEKPTGDDGLGADAFLNQGESLAEILANAPVVGGDQQSSDPAGEAGQPQQGEPGPPQGAQPQTAVFDLSSETPFRLRVDDETELDRDAILTAIKDHRDKANWVARHTKESQMMNFYHKQMTPEERDRFLAYGAAIALGKEKLPETLKPKPLEFDIALEHQGEYDDEAVTVKGKHKIAPDSDEYGKLRDHFYNQFMQEHAPVFREIKDHREAREKFDKDVAAWQEQAADAELKTFVRDNGYNIPTDGHLRAKLEEIISAGETHPHFHDVQRLMAVAQVANSQGITLAKAHELLYGETQKKAQAAAQQAKDRQKQKKQTPLRPGGQAPAQTETDRFIDSLGDPGSAASADLWSGKLN